MAWGAARLLVINSLPISPPDAIVVLGGASTYVERTNYAVRLYNSKIAPRIILTNDNQQGGWSSAQQRNPLFVERAEEELLRSGVPLEKIEPILEPVSSTYEEVTLLREYATTHHFHSLLVVTSGYHSRRALWTLQKVFNGSGIDVAIDSVPPGLQTPSAASWWLSAQGWRMVAGEYAKFIYYLIWYS